MHLSINICKNLSSAVVRPLRRTFQVHLAWQVIIQIWPTRWAGICWDCQENLIGLRFHWDMPPCKTSTDLGWLVAVWSNFEKFFSICFAPSCWKTINHPMGSDFFNWVRSLAWTSPENMTQNWSNRSGWRVQLARESFCLLLYENFLGFTKIVERQKFSLIWQARRSSFLSSCYLNYSIELFLSGESLYNVVGKSLWTVGIFMWKNSMRQIAKLFHRKPMPMK